MISIPRRRVLVIGVAGLLSACARTPSPSLPSSPRPEQPTLQPRATAAPTSTPRPTAPALATPVPAASAVSATPAPSPEMAVDVRLWNGEAEVQLDGRTIEPGLQQVPATTHQAAAVVDGQVVSVVDIEADNGGGVAVADLFVPPPLAGLAIMIENQADARPQTGLTLADVVYEALAEGGITRFMAIYLSADAPVIGPVRSLRHYFAFFAAEYGADLIHIGASPEGFAWRDAMNLGYLDESAGDPGVWRVRTRAAPHNAYTDSAADRRFLQARGRQLHHRWGPLRFGDPAPRGDDVAENIVFGFGIWSYRVAYQWDNDAARYVRYMDGVAHRDAASDEQIAPASVVVQFTEVDPIPGDPKLRLEVNLAGGSGQLMVFSAGHRRDGTWNKGAPNASTNWLDDQGKPMVLPRGPVWVEILPLGSPLSWS